MLAEDADGYTAERRDTRRLRLHIVPGRQGRRRFAENRGGATNPTGYVPQSTSGCLRSARLPGGWRTLQRLAASFACDGFIPAFPLLLLAAV